jgi:hypothetical protein
VIAGIVTAILSAAEQAYSPTKLSQTFWECRTQLEGIKKDIVACVIAMESATEIASGVGPLSQIAQRLTEGTKVPFDVLPLDRKAAVEAFNDSVLAGIIHRHEVMPQFDEEAPAVLGFDAPDIIAVSRQFSN